MGLRSCSLFVIVQMHLQNTGTFIVAQNRAQMKLAWPTCLASVMIKFYKMLSRRIKKNKILRREAMRAFPFILFNFV